MYENKVEIGKIYSTENNGKFKVICKINNFNDALNYYKIKFILTGYEVIVRDIHILDGYINDPYYYPKIFKNMYFGKSDMQGIMKLISKAN